MDTLEYCLQKARQITYKQGEKRHYCAIVDRRGRVVAESPNYYQKTHTLMAKASKKLGLSKDCIHSELGAIIKARKANKKGCKLYVVRVGSKNEPMLSAPCPTCQLLIKEAGFISSVEFSV